ncbi:hypothetical protein JCM10450v2_005996 [Rhodotorula kratochvilovae]
MTANYTGGGLSSRRRAKRRYRQDVTGTPWYTAAASQAYHARPGPLLDTSAHHLAGRRKGEPVAQPTFDFAYLHGHRTGAQELERRPATNTAGSRRGGESFWATSAPISTRPTEDLRQKLLAQPNWTGLRSVSRFQPSFLPSHSQDRPRVERRRPRSPSPIQSERSSLPAEYPVSILRGSSAQPDPKDDSFSTLLSGLPRSTPPPLHSSYRSSTDLLDAASLETCVSTEASVGVFASSSFDAEPDALASASKRRRSLPFGSRWTRPGSFSPDFFEPLDPHDEDRSRDQPIPHTQLTKATTEESFDDLSGGFGATGEPVGSIDNPASNEAQDEQDKLLFGSRMGDSGCAAEPELVSPTRDLDAMLAPARADADLLESVQPALVLHSPRSSAPANSPSPPNNELAALDLDPRFPGLNPYYTALASSLSFPLSACSPAPSPPPSPARAHLSHLRHPHAQHLPDSLTLPLPRAGALLAHERMGLGCERLSGVQAGEMLAREEAVRAAGEGAVPVWVWGDEGAEEDEVGEEGESGSEEARPPPPRTLSALDAAMVPDENNAAHDRPDRFRFSSLTVEDAHVPPPPRSTIPTPALPGAWFGAWDEHVDGQLFAPDDMSGVLEP